MSGPQGVGSRRARLEQLARAAGLECELAETDESEGARPLARRALEDGVERVLVSGGDGTVAEAAEVLAGTDVVLAVVPGGTGNLLAANFGMPLDVAAAIRLGMTGAPRRIDVGRANGHVFLIVAGMGADARMIRDAGREQKRRFGALAYFIAALRNLGRPMGRYRITIDGVRISRRAQTVLVANLGKITGGLELIPGADPLDGMLDVAIVRTRTLRDALMVGLRTLAGKHQNDNLTEIRHGKHVLIETSTPQPAEIDGNDLGSTRRLEVFVDPGALRLVVPEQTPSALPDPSALMAEMASRPALLPVAIGLATASILGIQRNRQEALGKQPNALTRRPWLVGLATGALCALIADEVRSRTTCPAQDEPSDAAATER